ncbi:MAG: hypothetical protein HYV00_02050, partial [Deltaproteobacteria bacterium]|nr:hypothetical protein [Deltaproteobacteria bacterium]
MLLLRGIALWRIDPVTFDSALYFEMAELIRAGRWADSLAYPYPPLFPILIAVLQEIGAATEAAGVALALTSGIVVLAPLVFITRTLAGEAAAL